MAYGRSSRLKYLIKQTNKEVVTGPQGPLRIKFKEKSQTFQGVNCFKHLRMYFIFADFANYCNKPYRMRVERSDFSGPNWSKKGKEVTGLTGPATHYMEQLRIILLCMGHKLHFCCLKLRKKLFCSQRCVIRLRVITTSKAEYS